VHQNTTLTFFHGLPPFFISLKPAIRCTVWVPLQSRIQLSSGSTLC